MSDAARLPQIQSHEVYIHWRIPNVESKYDTTIQNDTTSSIFDEFLILLLILLVESLYLNDYIP